MPFTQYFSIPYQAPGDAPHGPNLGEQGFTVVDTALQAHKLSLNQLLGQMGVGHTPAFTSAANRTSTLATILSTYGVSPAAGARCWMTDSERFEIFDGTYWVPQHGTPLGTNFSTGGNMSAGTSASGAAGSEASMTGTWHGSSTGTFVVPAGCLAALDFAGVVFQNTAFLLNGTVRLRKNNISGTVLSAFSIAIPPNTGALSQCFAHRTLLKNDTVSDVTITSLYATAQRQAGGGAGNYTLYGDSTNPLTANIISLGHVSASPALTAIAIQV